MADMKDFHAYMEIVLNRIPTTFRSTIGPNLYTDYANGWSAADWINGLSSKWPSWNSAHSLKHINVDKHNIVFNPSDLASILPPSDTTAAEVVIGGYTYNPTLLIMQRSDDSGPIIKALNGLGFIPEGGEFTAADVMIGFDLMYYYSLVALQIQPPMSSIESREMAYYLYNRTDKELLSLLTINYRGPTDRASMIFAAHTGQILQQTPSLSYSEDKYLRLADVDTKQIAWMVEHWNPLNLAAIGPYRFLAAQYDTPLTHYLYRLNESNFRKYAEQLGAHNINSMFDLDRWLLDYGENILSRPPEVTLRPLPIMDSNQLRFFTDQELSQHYDLPDTYSRSDLIEEIVNNRPRWIAQRYHYANNVNEDDVQTLEPRKEEFIKPDQQILSYGRIKEYQSWTVDELIYTFAPEPDGSYLFRNPSGSGGFFPLVIIEELERYLFNNRNTPEYRELLNIVRSGLLYHDLLRKKVATLENEYMQFTEEERSLITLYIFWLFTFGQYARFWKGPGHPYHVKQMNFADLPSVWQRPEFCTPFQRDVLSNIQLVIYKTILHNLSLLPNKSATTSWIKNLPLVRYNINIDEAVVIIKDGVDTIDSLLMKVESGQLCMMFASDVAVETAFFLARRVLGINSISEFNSILRTMLLILRQMELNIVSTMITEAEVLAGNVVGSRRGKLRTSLAEAKEDQQLVALRERLSALSVTPMPAQEDFDPRARLAAGN